MYTKKFYFDAKNHLPFSVLRCDQYPLRRKRKRAKNRRFTQVLARDATGINRSAKRRTGGDISHRNRTFLYTSLAGEINIQILNCAGSFVGVSWRTVARTAANRGQHYLDRHSRRSICPVLYPGFICRIRTDRYPPSRDALARPSRAPAAGYRATAAPPIQSLDMGLKWPPLP